MRVQRGIVNRSGDAMLSTMHFKDRVVFITGATSGIGEACALAFARAGARLIVCGRRKERLKALTKKLNGTKLLAFSLDVRDRDEVSTVIDSLPKEFAAVDVLVNNAGLALGLEPAHRTDLDDWEQMIDTNIKGLLYCTRAILPGMVARGRGHVINIGSVAGSYPYPGGNAYGATKAFVAQFSLNLRADLLGTPVRVTNIEPGMAETEFSLVRFQGNARKARAVYAGVRPLAASDIAEAVLWCAAQPAHVNVNRLEMMPVCQAFGPFAVSRKE